MAVATATVGTNLDPDGYAVRVNGGPAQAIALNAVLTLPGLEVGPYQIQLEDVAPTCVVQQVNPQTTTVLKDQTVMAPFDIACAAPVINGKLAFSSDRAGNREIYVMDIDGSEPGSPHQPCGIRCGARVVV